MKTLFSATILVCIIYTSHAQNISDSGTFLLHKFEQNIGKEKYVVTITASNINYDVDFKYVDRGSPVSLTASLQLTTALEPVSFRINGGTSRFSTVNDSVVISKKTVLIKVDDSVHTQPIKPNSFTIAGYSPATAQMLLIAYWNKHNKPALINMLPQGSVQISKDGEDTFAFNNQTLALQRYVIKGLIWGNELLWINEKGQLICLITNDAEGDKQEMVFEPYETLLPSFVAKAAVDGMKLFTSSAKPSFQKHDVIAITNGTLIDVINSTSKPNTTVIIENGKIASVGDAASLKIPAGAFTIDAKGKTIFTRLMGYAFTF